MPVQHTVLETCYFMEFVFMNSFVALLIGRLLGVTSASHELMRLPVTFGHYTGLAGTVLLRMCLKRSDGVSVRIYKTKCSL